ncbi:hypothetical protein B9479_001840 [Cryptococcus floricola]|uniref:RING-type E3 ubiquitin transferase n=1 Tax=Cryptococcus floricola TaxID=2591691 RepID=A0A5D3B383_9TREE|nr:hypothetical protein B9479_001840 [Cryptococcus floricola]
MSSSDTSAIRRTSSPFRGCMVRRVISDPTDPPHLSEASGGHKPLADGHRESIASVGSSMSFSSDHGSGMEIDDQSTSPAELDSHARSHVQQPRPSPYAQPADCHDPSYLGHPTIAHQRESSSAVPIRPPVHPSTNLPLDTPSRNNFPSYTSLNQDRPLLASRPSHLEDSVRAHIPSPVSSTLGVASPNALERRIDSIESRLDRSRQRDNRGRLSPGSRPRPYTAFPYEVPSHWTNSSGTQRPSPPRSGARDVARGEASHHPSPEIAPAPALRRYRHAPEERDTRSIPVNGDATVPSPRPSPYSSSFSASFGAIGEPPNPSLFGLRHRPVSRGMLDENGSSSASPTENAFSDPLASVRASPDQSAAGRFRMNHDLPPPSPVNPYTSGRHNTLPPPGNPLGVWDSNISLALIRHEAERTTERDRILADIRERDRERGPIVSALDIETAEEIARRRVMERGRPEVAGPSQVEDSDRQRIIERFRARQMMRDQYPTRARHSDLGTAAVGGHVAGPSGSSSLYNDSEGDRETGQRERGGRFGAPGQHQAMVLGSDGREMLNRDVNDFVDRRLGAHRAPLPSSGLTSNSHAVGSGSSSLGPGPSNGQISSGAHSVHGASGPSSRPLWGEVLEEGSVQRPPRLPPVLDLRNTAPVSFTPGFGGPSDMYNAEEDMADFGDEDDFLLPPISPWGQDGTPASAIAALQDSSRRRVPTEVIAALLARRPAQGGASNMLVDQGDDLRSIMEHLIQLGDGEMSQFASLAGLGSASISGKKLEPGMGEEEVRDTVECVVKYVKRSRDEKRRKWVGEMLEDIPWGHFGKREGMERDEYCSVCHDDYEHTTEISITPCKHMYHKSCLATWLDNPKTSTCPMCRRDLAVLSVLSSMVPDGKVETALPYWHRT